MHEPYTPQVSMVADDKKECNAAPEALNAEDEEAYAEAMRIIQFKQDRGDKDKQAKKKKKKSKKSAKKTKQQPQKDEL